MINWQWLEWIAQGRAKKIERKEPPEPWPARPAPREKVELCAACWSKITANSDRLDQIEFVEAKEQVMGTTSTSTADRRPVAACRKCSHLRSTGLGDHYCRADGPGKLVLCQDKNIDGTCPDFKQQPPQFNYLTGVWEA